MKAEKRKPECMDQAYKLLARRAHSVFEITQKLTIRGYDRADIDTAVDQLVNLGHLDDASYALEYARERVDKKRIGPRLLKLDLARKGIGNELIEETIDSIYKNDEDQLHSAMMALDIKLRTIRPGPDTSAMQKKLYDFLMRQGFMPDVVGRAMLTRFNDMAQVENDLFF